MLLSVPAFATWRVAESEHFRIFTRGSLEGAVETARMMEDYHRLLEKITNGKPPKNPARLDIYVVDRISEATPPGRQKAQGVAGFYHSGEDGMHAVAVGRNTLSANGRLIMFHEYAHHFMWGMSRMSYPTWYSEGFAEYLATAKMLPDRIEFGQVNFNRGSWLLGTPWIPPENFLSERMKALTYSQSGILYPQYWAYAHWLFRQSGKLDQLGPYMAEYARGGDPVALFAKYIDPNLDSINFRIRQYLRLHATSSIMKRDGRAAAEVQVRELTPSADDLLLMTLVAQDWMPEAERAKFVAAVRGKADAYVGDRFAQRAVAAAELFQGDPGTAAALLDRLLANQPDNPELLRWRAEAVIRSDGDPVEARRYLARSFKADQNDWRTLFRYAQLMGAGTKKLTPDEMDVLLRAYELAPQSDGVVFTAVSAFILDGDYDSAQILLNTRRAPPHGGEAVAARMEAIRNAVANKDSKLALALLNNEATQPTENSAGGPGGGAPDDGGGGEGKDNPQPPL